MKNKFNKPIRIKTNPNQEKDTLDFNVKKIIFPALKAGHLKFIKDSKKLGLKSKDSKDIKALKNFHYR